MARPQNPPPRRPPHFPPGWRPGMPVPPWRWGNPPAPPPMVWHPPGPLPPQPPPEPRGILWAFVPFLTFGFGTPFSFLYAALRRGSWGLGRTAAGYGVGTTGVLVLTSAGNGALTALGVILTMLLWVSGTVHAFAVRPSVFPRSGPRDRVNRYAVDVAKYRRELREEARALVAEDPALAHELRIGRPDLPRTYDDGGLVDVNHVPPATLALLPGMNEDLVERVVRIREEQGGFVSVEELAVQADLPPDLIPRLKDFTIFIP